MENLLLMKMKQATLKQYKKFYYDKTYDRINLFQEEFGYFDNSSTNGKSYPKLESILRNLNWDIIYDSLPCLFHGDLHLKIF